MSSRPSDILTAAFSVGEALFCVRQDQMRGENIFDGETQRFEYRNLVIILPCRKFSEFGRDVRCCPSPFGNSHHHIAGLLKRSGPRVDD